jgi:membrane protein DedA with SNARE-associated domain
VEWWDSVVRNTPQFVESWGLLVVALLLFVKACGVPLPIPGDLLIFSAGILVAEGVISGWLALIVLSLATLAGASTLFVVMRRVGRKRVDRYGHYVGLTDARLTSFEQRLSRRRWWTITVGRCVPGFRVATVVASVILDVPRRLFFSAAAAGAVIEVGICLLLGMLIGPPLLEWLDDLDVPWGVVLAMGVLVWVVVELMRGRRRSAPLSKP